MKHLSKEELLVKAKSLVAEERKITLELIEALREIERRMLFAELGYGSLFEFATRHLGLSEGSAQRRIQAMRLIRDVPEARARLESGELSLTNAARVQSFSQAEKRQGRPVEKREIIEQLSGLSQRECERRLLEISPESMPQERERIISPTERELRITVSDELYGKIEEIRGLLAHAKPNATLAELLELMTDATLRELRKQKPDQPVLVHTAAVRTKRLPSGVRVWIPRALKRQVWSRAQGRCEYECEARRCTSRYRLEIDHRRALALGGSNELENLRLLCRTHNHQQAFEQGLAVPDSG